MAPIITSDGVDKSKKGFQKGQSGNPKGRPKGSRNKTTLMAQALFDGEAETICKTVIERAVNKNDWPALKACLDRILPPLKSTPVVFELPTVKSLKDLVAAHEAVLSAFSAGDITADDARTANEMLEGLRRAMEAADLEERIARLEQTVGTS